MSRILIALTGFILLFISFLSCKNSGKSTPEATLNVRSDSESVNWSKDTFHVVEKLETESDVYYELYSQPSLPVQDSINAWVLSRLNRDFERVDISVSVRSVADVKKACIALNEEYLEYKAENDFTGPWSYQWNASISEPFKELACLYISEWNYLGGAHGNGSEYYRMFSVPEGKPLFLADVFTDINRLNQLAEKYFREQNIEGDNKQASLDEYGFEFENNRFAVNENFYLTPNELLIQYNPYEIGPYAMGAVSVAVPFQEIQPLLKISLTPRDSN